MVEEGIYNKYYTGSTTLVESELECQELSYSYPSSPKLIFKDISFRTCRGVAIVGPSGTGKSTFLSCTHPSIHSNTPMDDSS